MKRIASYVVGLSLLVSAPVFATAEVAGVKFEGKAKVGAAELVLNGAGLRSRLVLKVYAMALYLPKKETTADAAIGAAGAKRVHIVTLRELTAEQFADALVSGIHKNSSEAETAALGPKIEEFKATMLSLGTAAKGAVVTLDFEPGTGTQLVFNGTPRGKAIAGEDFYRALLRIWLGPKPAQDDLKEALLGKVG